MAERFLYLPSIGFAGCMVVAVCAAASRPAGPAARLASPAALVAICMAMAARTYVRNDDWLDDQSLWQSAVRASPASYKTHMALASSLLARNGARLDDAIREIERSFTILDNLPDERNTPAPYIDGGTYYGQKGESLARRNPDGTLASTPPGIMWYQKSLDAFLRAQRIEAANNRENRRRARLRGKTYQDTGWFELYLGLAGVYLRLSQPRQALAALEQGRRYKPVPEFFEKASDAYQALGDQNQAAIQMVEAYSIEPSDARVASRLVELYRRMDPSDCAVRQAGGSSSLNMDCPLVHEHFCKASLNLLRLYRDIGMAAAERTRLQALRDLKCPAAQSGQSP